MKKKESAWFPNSLERSQVSKQTKAYNEKDERAAKREQLKRMEARTTSSKMFKTALKSEQFGKHHGYVDIKLEMKLFDRRDMTWRTVPIPEIEMLCASSSDAWEIMDALRRHIESWSNVDEA